MKEEHITTAPKRHSELRNSPYLPGGGGAQQQEQHKARSHAAGALKQQQQRQGGGYARPDGALGKQHRVVRDQRDVEAAATARLELVAVVRAVRVAEELRVAGGEQARCGGSERQRTSMRGAKTRAGRPLRYHNR